MAANMEIQQTILYYPTISIRSDRWLRQSLLYWDEIGAIIPDGYDDNDLPSDVQYLKHEGIFRPFRPNQITHQGWEKVTEFESELVETITSKRFQAMSRAIPPKKLDYLIHQDKVNSGVIEFLIEAGLAAKRPDDRGWYYFEHKAALVYMAILAKYLADEDEARTVIGTNIRAYETLNFGTKSVASAFDGMCVRFFNILPVPRKEVSLHDILQYKRRKQNQLLHFRQNINRLQQTLSTCESKTDIICALSDFEMELKRSLFDLEETLADARIATVTGSLEALIKASASGWLASFAASRAKNIAEITMNWVLGATAVAGVIGVRKCLIDRRNERRAILRNSPFSYLHNARQDRIIT